METTRKIRKVLKGAPDGTLAGFQLWANLPAARKMMPARYRDGTFLAGGR
jgi:redox-sensitive bicupin YhaK (pirin superfamily)